MLLKQFLNWRVRVRKTGWRRSACLISYSFLRLVYHSHCNGVSWVLSALLQMRQWRLQMPGVTKKAGSSIQLNEWVKVAQSCPTLCDPMDYTDHGILQARILEWVAFPFSSGSSWPRTRTYVSHIAGRFFTNWAIREALVFSWYGIKVSRL